MDDETEMDDKQAVKILSEMLKRHEFSEEEKEAVRTAIGILGWTKLLEGYQENRKRARDRKLEDL
jgi:hypothetical protein